MNHHIIEKENYKCWHQINGFTKSNQEKTKTTYFGKQFRESEYVLNAAVTFCNNGAFSAVPKRVLDSQAKFRYIQETDPEAWFRYEVKTAISDATDIVAEMFGSNKENLVLVENTTTAANTVMKSLTWTSGDKILITTHTFLSVKNTAMFIANSHSDVEVITMDIHFPIESKEQLVDQLKETLASHTGIKLVILDHITGPSAILMPIEDMIPVCHQHGAMVLVDGAHAPGQVQLDLEEIGADFYVGNLHKWCYSARGCAILYVNPEHSDIGPTQIICCLICTAVKKYNERLLRWATDMLCEAWNTTVMPVPDSMRAPFMTLIRMPDIKRIPLTPDGSLLIASSVYHKYKLHISATRVNGRFWLRLSAHIYNTKDDYYKLRDAMMHMYHPQNA